MSSRANKPSDKAITEVKPNEVAKVGTTALARPSFIPEDRAGTDHITKDDIKFPRLALAQKTSDQLDPTKAAYIEGLKLGDMYNSLTGEIWGRGPYDFTVIMATPPRGIEFIPLEQGGGVKDFNVPLDDKRMAFGPNGEKPIATKFYDFIIMRLSDHELIGLSLKSTGLKVAKDLNGYMSTRKPPAPSYAGAYVITSGTDTKNNFTFAIYKVTNAGYIQDENTYKIAKAFHESFKGKNLVVDPEHPEKDDI